MNVMSYLIGIVGATPCNFGRRYRIPADYTDENGIHNHFLGSLMKYIGFAASTTPSQALS